MNQKISQYFDYYGIGKIDIPTTHELSDPNIFGSINEEYISMIMRIISALENLTSRLKNELPTSNLYYENFVIYSKLLDLFTELMEDVQYFMSLKNDGLYAQQIIYGHRYASNNVMNKYNEYLEAMDIFQKKLLSNDE